MSLKEQLLEDLKVAMRNKETIRKDTIQMTRSAVLQIEKDNKVTLDDVGVIEVIAKEVKKRKDSMPDFEKSGRQDLIDKLNTEIDVLMQYLPKQLGEEELDAIVKEVIADTGASSMKDMGKVMQAVIARTIGRADGKMINQLVKKNLQ